MEHKENCEACDAGFNREDIIAPHTCSPKPKEVKDHAPQREDWELDFAKRFGVYVAPFAGEKFMQFLGEIRFFIRSEKQKSYEEGYEYGYEKTLPEQIKIASEEIEKHKRYARQDLIERLKGEAEKIKYKHTTLGYSTLKEAYEYGYNKSLDEVLSLLDNYSKEL